MTKVTLKGLGLHKARAVLTTLAVVIGVAMISGAYVVSDTMLSAATSLSGAAYDNTDAVVTKKQAFTNGSDTIGTAGRATYEACASEAVLGARWRELLERAIAST